MSVFIMQSSRGDEDSIRILRRRLYAAIAVLVITVIVSTLGLLLLGRHGEKPFSIRLLEAFWDTLNLVSTVGSLEEDFTVGQRLWAILIIAFGLGAVLFGFGTLQTLIQQDFVRLYARRKMKKTLDTMHKHIIVCGYGQVGRAVTADLLKSSERVVIIDEAEAPANAADAAGLSTIQADSTREHTLELAGVRQAQGLVACLDSDAANVYLIMMAREFNPDIRIVARAEREDSCPRMIRAGADQVIVPGDIAGLRMANMLRKPNFSAFMDQIIRGDEYEFAELPLRDHPVFTGKSLRDLDLTGTLDTIVISIVDADGRHSFNPDADRRLGSEDVLLVVSRGSGLERLYAAGKSTSSP